MPAITREYCPNTDPLKLLLDPDRKQEVSRRLLQIITDIHDYEGDPDEVVTAWRRNLWDEWEYLRDNVNRKINKSGITDADIARAKAYPIDKIIQFKNGVAEAWCHADKSPSLVHWKGKNLARCFVCDKTFSPIDVFMDWQGIGFSEAVKMLR